MDESWCALYLCIIKNITRDKAFLMLRNNATRHAKQTQDNRTKVPYITSEDVEKMVELKKSHTYKEIAKMWKTSPQNVWNWINKRSLI